MAINVYGTNQADLLNTFEGASTSGVNYFGYGGNDTIRASKGDDTLDGGTGADSLVGGIGNNVYILDNTKDVIATDPGGTDDEVHTPFSYSIASRSDLEHITLLGKTATSATGNLKDNMLVGNEGNNTLDGAEGADTLIGGKGNDIYIVDNIDDWVYEVVGEGNDTIKFMGSFGFDAGTPLTITASEYIENIDVSGMPHTNIIINGNTSANILTGNNGDNELSGLDGIDTLIGGSGDDTYVVNLVKSGIGSKAIAKLEDVIVEKVGEGTADTLWLDQEINDLSKATTLVLANGLEHLYAADTGLTLLNLTGNTANNEITGNAANNIILGVTGNDTLDGLEGDDSLDGGVGNDELWGGIGNDTLIGGTGDDTLYGGDGNDTLIGGTGADSLEGGTGNDTYVVALKSVAGVAVLEDAVSESGASGIDTLRLTGTATLVNYTNLNLATGITGLSGTFENIDANATGTTKLNLTGDDEANYLTGNAAANTLAGGIGNDTLDGGAGNDTLIGETGTDKLFGNIGNDSIDGGDGNDFIDGGAGNDAIIGGIGQDTLFGGLGNDSIDGGDDADFIDGEAGNDTLMGGAGDDDIYGGAGNDSIDGGAGYNILEGEDGNDTIIGGNDGNSIEGDAGNDSLTGGNGDDLIEGGIGNDTLQGLAGHDILEGGAGSDILNGGDDDDYLEGGDGIDTLTGGLGADTFNFSSPVIAANADIIKDFNSAEGDKIQLDAYFFNAFLYSDEVISDNIAIGTKATTADHHLIYDEATGKLYYDADGVGGKAQVLLATLANKPLAPLVASDFEINGSMAGSDPITQGTNAANTWNANNEAAAPHYSYNGLAGNDTIIGHTTIGNSLSGGVGNDSITGGSNNDYLYGNEGNDIIFGGDGMDWLSGSDGNDSLFGGDGDDDLSGGIGNDKLEGGAGVDDLKGGDGNDTLIGGDGNDMLYGGKGIDLLTGGSGEDIFIFDRPVLANNVATITDFTSGEDSIWLRPDAFRKLANGVSEENLAFGTKATSLEHYLIYDSNTGNLFYDADGSGAGAAIRFATFSNKPASIDTDDFQIF